MALSILALDMATTTGWAHSCGLSGIWDLKVRPDESSDMRLIRFRAKLREIYDAYPMELIVFEQVTAGNGPKSNLNGIKLGAKLQAILEVFCVDHEVQRCGYNLSTIKKFATNGGKATKDEMLAAARKRWDDVIDDNHADALWMLELAKSEYGRL